MTFLHTKPYIYTEFLLYNLGYHSSSYSLIGSIVAYTTSTNSLSFTLSSYNTWLIRSVTLASSSSPLSSKISVISKLSIRGAVLSSLFAFIYAKWLIMPPQRLLPQAHHHALLVVSILLQGIVIGPCSRCVEKGLVCVAIVAPSGY